MQSTLLLLHTESDGSLAASGFEALSAALSASAGGTLAVGLIGQAVQPAANQIANCGACRILAVTGSDFAQSRYSTDAAAAEALCRAANASLVIAPATTRWNRVVPGVAQRLGGRADTHVTGASWIQTHVKDAERLILGFLARTQASLGGSKSLVDLSGEGHAVLPFLTHLNQIGQTGSTPRHPKGLATCCHGEEPHAVGWRFITDRRAISLDPNCGWARGKADVLYVADAFAVLEELTRLL